MAKKFKLWNSKVFWVPTRRHFWAFKKNMMALWRWCKRFQRINKWKSIWLLWSGMVIERNWRMTRHSFRATCPFSVILRACPTKNPRPNRWAPDMNILRIKHKNWADLSTESLVIKGRGHSLGSFERLCSFSQHCYKLSFYFVLAKWEIRQGLNFGQWFKLLEEVKSPRRETTN